MDAAYRAGEEPGWGSTDRRVFVGSPVTHGRKSSSTEQPPSPSRGVRRQPATAEAPPAAQRARILELQRLATERGELEAQLAEVKRLMRESNLGNTCWKAAATGILGDGLPKTQARIVQRNKRKRRPSTAPLVNVARDTVVEYPTTRRAFEASCPRGKNGQSAWVEHSTQETTGYSAEDIRRRRRNGSEERGDIKLRGRQHIERITYERVVPERERPTVMCGTSYYSTDRPASAESVRNCPRRSIFGENMAATLQRPQSSPRRPTANSRPPLPNHPIGHQRMEVAATTTAARGMESEYLHSQGSLRFPTSERHCRETRKSPCYANDGFPAGEGRLKGGHWERGSHEQGFSSRYGGISPPSAWVEDDRLTSSTARRLGRESIVKRQAVQAPASLRYHRQSNVVEDIDNYDEDDFKVVSSRGSYEYVFVPWGHTLVPKREDGIANPVSPREGGQHARHDCRQSRANTSHHKGAEGAIYCRNSSDNLGVNNLVAGRDNVLDHSDSRSGGREARSPQGDGASTWREWNRSDENDPVFQAWDNVIHKARGHRNGHVFEHLWIEYGENSTASGAETRPGGSVATEQDIRNTTFASRGNLSAERVESQQSIDHESKNEKRCSGDEDGKVPAPQSEGGSSLYNVLLSDGSNSDETWSMGSLEQSERSEALNPRDAGGAPALKGPSGSSAQQRSSPRPRLGSVAGGRKALALVTSSSDGSSLYNNFSHGSHESVLNQRAIIMSNPSVPFPPPRRRENQHDLVLQGCVGNSTDLAVSRSEGAPTRSPSDARMARPEDHAEYTTSEPLAHVRQHAPVKQQGEVGVRGAFDERSRDTLVKRLSQSDMRSTDDKESPYEILFNKGKLDDETTTGNDGGRWATEHGDASQGRLEGNQPFEPAPFAAKPHQRRLDTRRSTDDGQLDKHALARHEAVRSMRHRARSLGSLVVQHTQGYLDESLLFGKPRLKFLGGEGLKKYFLSLDQQASEGTGAGSSLGNHGRAVEEQKAEEASLIGDSGFVGKGAQAAVSEDTPVDAAISADDQGFAHSRSPDSKNSNNIDGEKKIENSSHGDEPKRVGRDKSLADERTPSSGETPASENSGDRERGPDLRDERIVDNKAQGDHLSRRESQCRQSREERSHLEEDTAIARGLDSMRGDIRVRGEELQNNGSIDGTTLNEAQHNNEKTLAGWGYVEKRARDDGIDASEGLDREGELENVGSFDGLSPQHMPHRALTDKVSFGERGRYLKKVLPVAEGTSASSQGLTNRTKGGYGRFAESIVDREDALAVSAALRHETDDQRKLVAEIAAGIVAEIVAVGGKSGDSERGGRRSVGEKEFKKSREVLDEASLESQQRPAELLEGGSADGWTLNDGQPAEYPSAQHALDGERYHGRTLEDLASGSAGADGGSTHHELPDKLLAEKQTPHDGSEDNNVGARETLSSAVGKGGGVTDDSLDADTPLDEKLIASLDKEQKKPHGAPTRQGLRDGDALLAGELPNERPVVGGTQTHPQEDGDSFDGSAGGRSPGSMHSNAETKHTQPDGEGSLDEYLFDGESSGDHSLDGNSFDGQSLSDRDSESESSFGGSSPDAGSADGVSAVDDDLLFDAA